MGAGYEQYGTDLRHGEPAVASEAQNVVTSFVRLNARTNGVAEACRELGPVSRLVAGQLASSVSPIVGDAVSAFSGLGAVMTRLPLAGGAAVGALVAVGLAAKQTVSNLNDLQETQSKVFRATERGDIGSLRGIVKDLGDQFDLLRRQQLNAAQLFDKLLGGDLRGAFESAVNAVQYGTSRGFEAIERDAKEAGKGIRELLPLETRQQSAEFAISLNKVTSSMAELRASTAESENDLEQFTIQIQRQRQLVSDLATAQEKLARVRAEVETKEVQSRGLDPAAQQAELAAVNARLNNAITLIGAQALASDAALQERLRQGRLNIIDRQQQAFPAEPGIEDVGRHESLAAGIALDPETLARARKNADGYDKALSDLNKTHELLGASMDLIAEKQDLVGNEMRRLIAAGIEPTDERLQELKKRFDELTLESDLREDFRAIGDEFRSFTIGVVSGTTEIQDAFRGLGQNLGLSLIDLGFRQVLRSLENEIQRFLESQAFRTFISTLVNFGVS